MSDKFINTPILVVGVPRSGTSMVAGAIAKCNVFIGRTGGAHKDNVKGVYENIAIRKEIIKPYLRAHKYDPLGQYPLPETDKLTIPTEFKSKVLAIMQRQGYTGGPWMIKEPKITLMWPVWHYHYPNAKWVIVRRRTEDISHSCCRTSYMKAFRMTDKQNAVGVTNEFDGWVWWAKEYEKRFHSMLEEGVNCKVIWPERMVQGDYSQLMDLVEWLGCQWNSRIVGEIDPKLWKARKRGKSWPGRPQQK